MQAVHRKAQPGQLIGQGGGGELGVAEHHHPLVPLADDQLRQIGQLVAARRLQLVLGDLGLALLFGLDGDLLGVPLIEPADVHHLAADGGREHGQGLAVLHQVDDLPHVLVKAHVQHLVGLVQHDLGHMAQVDAAVPVVVHQAAGGGHHDLAALGQAAGLLVHIGAAVYAGHLDRRHKVGQVLHVPGDLLGQLPGGRQDDGLRVRLVRLDVLGHRDAEGAGLAGAGGGLGDHVPARHHQRDHLFLDLGHFVKAHPLHGLVDGLAAL